MLVEGVCAWCGNFLRLPARKILVEVVRGFGWMVCVSSLESFVSGVDEGELESGLRCRFGMWQVKELDVVLYDWLTLGLVFVSSQVWVVVLFLIVDVGAE